MGENQSRIEFVNPPQLLVYNEVVKAILEIATNNNRVVKKLIYHFVTREKILEINRNHLQHDYETDVITFDYGKGKSVKGDVFVCFDVIKENAVSLRVDVSSELNRVVFHGLLHLLGFNDGTEEEIRIMRAEEEVCLALIP